MPSPSRPAESGPTLKTERLRAQPSPEAVARARRLVRARLPEWGLDSLTDDCALVVSELVTNALLHAAPQAGPPLLVELRLTPTHLVARVHDASASAPRRRTAAADEEAGRGLDLVEHIAHHWNWYTTPRGKCVWAAWTLSPAGS